MTLDRDDWLADLRAEHGYISDDERERAEQMHADALCAWAAWEWYGTPPTS